MYHSVTVKHKNVTILHWDSTEISNLFVPRTGDQITPDAVLMYIVSRVVVFPSRTGFTFTVYCV